MKIRLAKFIEFEVDMLRGGRTRMFVFPVSGWGVEVKLGNGEAGWIINQVRAVAFGLTDPPKVFK